MRKGRDGEEKKGGKKEKTDDYSGHYIIASSWLPERQPPEQRPLERRTLVPKIWLQSNVIINHMLLSIKCCRPM